MDAIEILIADSLAESLSLAEFAGDIGSVTAVRKFVPDYEAADLGTLKVSVVPGATEVSNLTHGADLFEVEIHVVIAKRFTTDAELDDLVDLRTQIVDAIRSKTLPASTPAMPNGVVWMGITNQTTFDRDALTDRRVFLADIAVVYRRSQAKVTA